MNAMRKIAYGDIDPAHGGALIEQLIDGELLMITDVEPVQRLQEYVRRLVKFNRRLDDATDVDRFFESHDSVDIDCLAEIYKAFQHIRDCRLLSTMFAPLVRGIGGHSEILIDTGHFRCIAPSAYDALRNRADMAGFFTRSAKRTRTLHQRSRAWWRAASRHPPSAFHVSVQYVASIARYSKRCRLIAVPAML